MKYYDCHLKENSEKTNFISPKKTHPKARVFWGLSERIQVSQIISQKKSGA